MIEKDLFCLMYFYSFTFAEVLNMSSLECQFFIDRI
jgi:hypothetical protein